MDSSSDRMAGIGVKAVLLEGEVIELLQRLRQKASVVGEYCVSAAGIVTAANDYFILSEEETERKGLKPWARNIVKKGSYLPKSPLLTTDDVQCIARTLPCNLIDFHWDKAPELTDVAKRYIETCEEVEIHRRYKCRRRNPWFRIPIVEAQDGVFFKRAHAAPRFCVNSAKVLVTDTAYQVRANKEYRNRGFGFFLLQSTHLAVLGDRRAVLWWWCSGTHSRRISRITHLRS